MPRYKSNTQKSIAFLCTSNKQLNLKIKTTSFTILSKKMKEGINIAKYVQDVYEENYKTLVKEIKDDLN